MPHIDVNGRKISFEDSGGSGGAVLLVHGFLLDRAVFDPQMPALEGRRAIRVDVRGFGGSSHGDQDFTLWDIADDCAKVLDHLGVKRAVVVGQSMGGFIAQRFALRYPDRVEALIFIGTHGFADPPEAVEGNKQILEGFRAAGPVPPILDVFRGVFFGGSEAGSSWVDRWKSLPSDTVTRPGAAMIDRDDITARLGELKAPSLVLHGTADQAMPLFVGEQFAKALPGNKRFVSIEGGPHVINVTHAEQVNEAIRAFLAELS